MHVGIADQHGKDQPTDKLVGGFLAGFRPENGSDIGIAAAPVLVIGKQPEHLREILHVHGAAAGDAVDRSTARAVPPAVLTSCGSPFMLATATRRSRGTAMPTRRASSSIANSVSGTAGNRAEGSFTIQDPPMPSAGTLRPPEASMTAENFNCTPAREKRIAERSS